MEKTNPITATNVQDDVLEVIEALKMWHANTLSQLRAVVNMPAENDLVIQLVGSDEIHLDKHDRAFCKMGIQIAIEAFEKFPLTVSKPTPIFLEGAEAWLDCSDLADCPYPDGSSEATEWKAGWTSEEES